MQSMNKFDSAGQEGPVSEKLQEIKDRVINAIAETMDLYGVAYSVGRLYGTLYFQRFPMTLDQMKDALGMSKSSMSLSIRALQDMKAVQKVWQKGTRKDLYVAEKDFFKFFQVFFATKWRREIEVNMKAIKEATAKLEAILNQEELSPEQREEAEFIRRLLLDSKEYYLWLEALVEKLESGELFQLVKPRNKS
jgi:DNA-binding transcriptional regulator GbsR (MarR family)